MRNFVSGLAGGPRDVDLKQVRHDGIWFQEFGESHYAVLIEEHEELYSCSPRYASH